MQDEKLIQQAADLIRHSQHLVVLTGAGVSKESGVPTFRDALDGLWARYDPQQLATPFAFKQDPKLVWDWYTYRRELVGQARPNPGHAAIAALEKRLPTLTLITQNVDDLHEQAGSNNVIHLHGKLNANKCVNHCQGDPTLVDIMTLTWDRESGPPPCPHCGAPVRPDVVWFHEMLPPVQLYTASEACQNADVMLVVGTSGLVTPAADLPRVAKRCGAQIIEVNPDYSMITRFADIKLEGPSGAILPRVIAALDS
jgi:NAD-dependent deacetylase